jgi:hypothetical protein
MMFDLRNFFGDQRANATSGFPCKWLMKKKVNTDMAIFTINTQ